MRKSVRLPKITALLVVIGLFLVVMPVAAQDPLELDATQTITDTDDETIALATFSYPSSWTIEYTSGVAVDQIVEMNLTTPDGLDYFIQVWYQGRLSGFGLSVPTDGPIDLTEAINRLERVVVEGRGLEDASIEVPDPQTINGRDFVERIFVDAAGDTTDYYSLGVGRLSSDFIVLVIGEMTEGGPSLDRATFDQANATANAIAASIVLNDSIFVAPDLVSFDPTLGGNTDVASTDGFTDLIDEPYAAFSVQALPSWELDWAEFDAVELLDTDSGYELRFEQLDPAELALYGVTATVDTDIVTLLGELIATNFSPSDDFRFETGVLSFAFENGTYAEFIYSFFDEYAEQEGTRKFNSFGVFTPRDGTQFFVYGEHYFSDLDAFLAVHTTARAIISTFAYQSVGFDVTGRQAITPTNAATLAVVGGLADGDLFSGTFGFVGDSNTVVFTQSSDFVVLDVATGRRVFSEYTDSMWSAAQVLPVSETQVLLWSHHDDEDGTVVQLWDVAAQDQVYEREFVVADFSPPSPNLAALFAGGAQVVFVSAEAPSTLTTLDVATGETVQTTAVQWDDSNAVGALTAFNDTLLLCRNEADTTTLFQVDPASGEIVNTVAAFAGLSYCDALAFSPDGQVLVYVGRIDYNPTIAFLDVANGFSVISSSALGITEDSYITISPDGTLVAVAGNEALMVYETATGQVVHTLTYSETFGDEAYVYSASARFSPDGTLIGLATDALPILFVGIPQ